MTELVDWTYAENNRRVDKAVLKSGVRIPADLVLVAIGFRGAEAKPFAEDGLEMTDDRGRNHQGRRTHDDQPPRRIRGRRRQHGGFDRRVGDRRGRDVACHIDRYLMGTTRLPASLRTTNMPIERLRWKIVGGVGR